MAWVGGRDVAYIWDRGMGQGCRTGVWEGCRRHGMGGWVSESQLLCLNHEVSNEVARPFPICHMVGNIAARSACLGDVLPHLPFVIRALDKFGDMQVVAMVRSTVVAVPPGLPSPFRVPHRVLPSQAV